MAKKSISQGLKPDSWDAPDAQAEASAYHKSKGEEGVAWVETERQGVGFVMAKR